ncbi:MAG: CsbD family protein [Actinomycetota bacterium]|nr:CsbD family protein [Actinomycetota bacterium]
MGKSSKQDRAEGLLYKVGGRVLQAIGSLTGDQKKKVKGRLGRGKGTAKGKEGRLKDLFK